MANSISFGVKRVANLGLTSKEVDKYQHQDQHIVLEGYSIIPVPNSFMEREVLVEGTAKGRALSCLCVVRHGDGKSFHVEDFALSWLAGREHALSDKGIITKSERTGNYYIQYEDTGYNAQSLPLREGGTDFAHPILIKVGKQFNAFKTKSFDFVFEKTATGSWGNTKKILDLVDQGIFEVDLAPTTRWELTQEPFTGKLTKEELALARTVFKGMTGEALK